MLIISGGMCLFFGGRHSIQLSYPPITFYNMLYFLSFTISFNDKIYRKHYVTDQGFFRHIFRMQDPS